MGLCYPMEQQRNQLLNRKKAQATSINAFFILTSEKLEMADFLPDQSRKILHNAAILAFFDVGTSLTNHC